MGLKLTVVLLKYKIFFKNFILDRTQRKAILKSIKLFSHLCFIYFIVLGIFCFNVSVLTS